METGFPSMGWLSPSGLIGECRFLHTTFKESNLWHFAVGCRSPIKEESNIVAAEGAFRKC